MNNLKFYKKNGYCIIKNIFDAPLVLELKNSVKKLFLQSTQSKIQPCDLSDNEFFELQKMIYQTNFNAYLGAAKCANHLIELYQLAAYPKLLTQLKELECVIPSLCARPLMWFHAPSVAKTERYHKLPAHQEWSNMQGSINGMVAWSPLTLITEDMGQLQIIPGSHQQGLLPFSADIDKDYPFSIASEHYNTKDFISVHCDITDCIIFSSLLIHRSGLNQSNKIRWSINFRYNDISEPSFIKRNYLNPFIYQASPQLVDEFKPDTNLIGNLFDE